MSHSLLDSLIRDAIGFDWLNQFGVEKVVNYPPHNIVKVGENAYKLVLAVAGFSRPELEVSLKEGVLTVKGTKDRGAEAGTSTEMLYQGLALRDFERTWKLGEYMEIGKVALMDGLLTISVERNVPEAKQARKFDIN